jgi:hypothetical protein
MNAAKRQEIRVKYQEAAKFSPSCATIIELLNDADQDELTIQYLQRELGRCPEPPRSHEEEPREATKQSPNPVVEQYEAMCHPCRMLYISQINGIDKPTLIICNHKDQ